MAKYIKISLCKAAILTRFQTLSLKPKYCPFFKFVPVQLHENI